MRKYFSILFILTLLPIFLCDEETKQINIAFFLNENDDLEELIIRSSVNIVNSYYLAERYFLNPFIYKIKKNDIFNLRNMICQILDKGIAVIFGSELKEISELIQSAALNFEIPQFQMDYNPNFSTFSKYAYDDKSETTKVMFNFNLYPSPAILSEAFATFVRESDWKSYTIIYENDDGLIRLQEVLNEQKHNDPPVTFRKLGPGPDHRTILKEVVSSGALHIILDCEANHLLDILLQAQEVKLLEEYHTYLLTSLDAHTVDYSSLGDIKANISTVSILNKNVMEKVIANWEMMDSTQQLRIPSRAVKPTSFDCLNPETKNYATTFNSLSTWGPLKSTKVKAALLYDAFNLFITTFTELDTTQKMDVKSLNCETRQISTHGLPLAGFIQMRNLTRGLLEGPISGPITFDSFGQRNSYKAQINEITTNHQMRVTGIWESNNPHILHTTLTSEEREKEMYQQLKGRTFRVVSRIYPPYLSRKPGVDSKIQKGNYAFEGYAMDLMDGICKIYECKYIFELVPDNNYGRYDPKTKEWNGLIRHLLDRKADLAICDLTTTYERRKAVDFTNPFMTLGISILYARVVKEPPELLAFTNPLSLDVWLYMITAYMIISMIIFLVARLNPNEWENPHPCDPCPEELENIWTPKNCFWLTLGSIMQQGCDILPKGVLTRVVTGMWWFFTLIMISCYTANLAAFLTQERMGPTIENAEDLASQTQIKYGCLRDGATASFFRDTNVSTYHKMWVQMESAEPSVFEKSNDDGVKRVISSKGKYAFLMESSSIEYEVERHCELVQVGNRLDTKGYGIAMPTNAPYRTSINQAILKMQESGTLQRLKDKWWKDRNKAFHCKKDEVSNQASANELTLAHVGGVFVVLAGGMCIAMTIAVFEFLWNIKKIAINEHMALKEVFIRELKFAMNIWARQKPVNYVTTPNFNINLDMNKKDKEKK